MPLKILGSRIDPVSFQETLDRIRGFLRSTEPNHIITGNTLMMLAAEEDVELHAILEKAALVTPESSGILWASRRMGSPLKEFTPGIDLMLAVCGMAASFSDGVKIFLLGSQPDIVEQAAQILRQKFPSLRIVGTYHGYFPPQEEPVVIEKIRAVKPSILFVGMGMPAQEKWIARNLTALGIPVVMGVGGSFDVLSGKLRRAPTWMRRLGIEWLYRLAQEPWRWRRIAQLPVFAWHVYKETMKRARSNK